MPVEDEDLEDGEIEDDDDPDECVIVEPPKPVLPAKAEKTSQSTQKRKSSPDSHHSNKKSSGTSSSRRDKVNNPEEEDFMTSIENALAAGLKKSGIEPPMPNVKKSVEHEQEPESRNARSNRKRRKRKKDRKDQNKRETGSTRVSFAKLLSRIFFHFPKFFSKNDKKSMITTLFTWWAGVPAKNIQAARLRKKIPTAAMILKNITDRTTKSVATSDVKNTETGTGNESVNVKEIEIATGRTRRLVKRRKFV